MKKSKSHQERAQLRLSRAPEFYRQFVADFAGSGLTLAQYCRKYRVGENTFDHYTRDSTRGTGKPKPEGRSAAPRMVQVLPTVPQEVPRHPFEIQLLNWTFLRLAHLDAPTLAILRALLMEVAP